MAIRNDTVTLDIRDVGKSAATLHYTAHDKGATVTAVISDSGSPLDLSGLTAVFRADTPSGYVERELPVSGSTATYTLSDDVTASEGRVRACIALMQGDAVIASTQHFFISIEKCPDLSDEQATFVEQEFAALKGDWLAQMESQDAMFYASETARGEAEDARSAAEDARVEAEADRAASELGRTEAEGLRASAESGRAAAEAKRLEDENARISAETARASAEQSRASAESARASAEQSRVAKESERASAEGVRIENESARVESESGREQSETARAGAEKARDAAESSRSSAEASRAAAESSRVSAENARKSAESSRASAETARADAESKRISSETARASAEQSRASAESARASADADREERQAKNDADQALNNEAARNNQPYVCSSGEYDVDTLAPTVDNPVAGRIYLVPLTEGQALDLLDSIAAPYDAARIEPMAVIAEAAASGNAYVEWLYLNSRWEQIGVSQKQVTPISTAEIDSVASGASPQGESVLNLTGLSYLWSKVKAAFAPLSHSHSASDVTSGTLPIARGGTGATSAKAAEYAIHGTPATATSAVSDTSPIVYAYASPSASQGTFFTRTASTLWAYIKGKADSVYAAASHTHVASAVTGLTASRALVSDASGHPSASAVTSTELGYLDGVTSSVQTQLNGKAASSHTHSAATQSANGMMSAADKKKLDGVATGATAYSDAKAFLANHPVGSYFITSSSANPASTYGGTWEAHQLAGVNAWKRTK